MSESVQQNPLLSYIFIVLNKDVKRKEYLEKNIYNNFEKSSIKYTKFDAVDGTDTENTKKMINENKIKFKNDFYKMESEQWMNQIFAKK